jgi:hypothetical protein
MSMGRIKTWLTLKRKQIIELLDEPKNYSEGSALSMAWLAEEDCREEFPGCLHLLHWQTVRKTGIMQKL